MNHVIMILALCPLSLLQSETPHTDLLHFKNGDSLHGTFQGLDDNTLTILRDDLDTPLKIKQTNLSTLSLNGGNPRTHLDEKSYISLTNGDIIPGKIISLDKDTILFHSPIAGELTIPREKILSAHPSPTGGNLLYTGPYTTQGWHILLPLEKDKDRNDDTEQNPTHWTHSSTAWYNLNESPLISDINLGESTKINFKIKWKKQLNTTFIFHADLKRPVNIITEDNEQKNDEDENPAPPQHDEQDSQKDNQNPLPIQWESITDIDPLPGTNHLLWLKEKNTKANHAINFGSCYGIIMNGNHPILFRCSFSENGTPYVDTIHPESNYVNFINKKEALFELRINRKKSTLSLYINDQYIFQYKDPLGYAGNGSHIAFISNDRRNEPSLVRISEITASTWNGVSDTARSMQHEERDIILLNNGTDRFSGKIYSIQNDTLKLKNNYTDLTIPIQDIQLINFSQQPQKELQEKIEEAMEDEDLFSPRLHYSHGVITITPLSADQDTLRARSSIFGMLNLKLKPATLLEFSPSNPAIQDWEDHF